MKSNRKFVWSRKRGRKFLRCRKTEKVGVKNAKEKREFEKGSSQNMFAKTVNKLRVLGKWLGKKTKSSG